MTQIALLAVGEVGSGILYDQESCGTLKSQTQTNFKFEVLSNLNTTTVKTVVPNNASSLGWFFLDFTTTKTALIKGNI